jgi:hypothetical protein
MGPFIPFKLTTVLPSAAFFVFNPSIGTLNNQDAEAVVKRVAIPLFAVSRSFQAGMSGFEIFLMSQIWARFPDDKFDATPPSIVFPVLGTWPSD